MRVVRRAVVDLVMLVVFSVMIRGRERRSGEPEEEAKEDELLHGYQHDTARCRRRSEI